MKDVIKLLEKLVKIESPSGKEEEISNFILDFINKLGFNAKKDKIGNILLNSNSNLWIVTHMDTVKKKSEFKINGKIAYGTGVCDAKGSITAILTALKRIKNLKYGIAILVDEEEGGTGSKFVLERYKPKYAIVMEPTSLKIANKHYGSLEVEIEVFGHELHGACFEFTQNPIDVSLKILNELKSKLKFLIQEIKGGGDLYVTPSNCKMRLDFPISPDKNVAEVKKTILGILNKFNNIKINVTEACNGFTEFDIPKAFLSALKTIGLEVKYTTMLSWTDAINFKHTGCKTIVWGPGELKYCHTKNEMIKLDEILTASKVLVKLNSAITNHNEI